MPTNPDELAAFVVSEIDGAGDDIAQQIAFARVLRALQEH